MNIGAKITYGVIASWANRAVAIGLNLILMPILFQYMGREELGLWFLLGQSGAFLALMDFGLAPTLIRRIAFANSRRMNLNSGYFNKAEHATISELIAVASILYRSMAVAVFFLSWGAGLLFLNQLTLEPDLYQKIFWAWTIMSFGYALSVWAGYWPCLLQGLGYVSANLYIGMAVSILVASAQIVIVLIGGGLVELAIVFAAGALLTRFAIVIFLYIMNPLVRRKKSQWRAEVFTRLLRPAMSAWITVLGGFLVLKTDQYFIAAFRGAAEVPAYHAAYQLTSNIYMLAVALAGSAGIFISYLWEDERYEQVRFLAIKSLQSGLSIMVCGIACLILVGENIINLWLGVGNFIGGPVMMVFCIALFLQAQHEMFMTLSRATEDESYAIVSLVAGGLNLVFTFFMIRWLGLLGVALGTLLSQLLSNNWYGVYRGTMRLGISPLSYILEIALPVIVVFCIALYAGKFAIAFMEEFYAGIYGSLAVVLATGFVLLCSLLIILLPTSIKYLNPTFRKGTIR